MASAVRDALFSAGIDGVWLDELCTAFAEPENILLLLAVLVSSFIFLCGRRDDDDDDEEEEEEAVPLGPPPPPPEKKQFTLEELARHQGEGGSEVLMACKGIVYHVDPMHYGTGAGYHVFAGKDVSRHLGKMLVGDEEANQRYDTLTEKETGIMNDWEEKFLKKYDIWGWLVEDFVRPPVDVAALQAIASPTQTGGGGDADGSDPITAMNAANKAKDE